MYSIELKPQAQKFIEAQSKKVQQQLIKRIETLATNPHPPQSKLLYSGELWFLNLPI
jgi:mRNA-degrading endonuclease RelE of RelBE toxin-antitoxin system